MTVQVLPGREELAGDAFFQDPYPYYARLRAGAEPYWLAHEQHTSSGGVLLFSRYRDALAIFSNTHGISKNLRGIRRPGTGSAFDLHMLHRDGADHLRLRRLVSEWFSMQAVEDLRPMMRNAAATLLAGLPRDTEIDFIGDFAEPLPLQVIARVIGIPVDAMPQVRAWSLLLGDGFDSLLSNTAVLAAQRQALAEFLAYVETLISMRRAQPDASLLGYLVQAGPQRIGEEELAAMVGFLLFAGHETTVSLLGNAVWLLLSHPEQRELLRAQPQLLSSAIEEVLRYESPEQRTSFRLVNAPLDIEGCRLEPGQQIGVIIGSANRDEAAFDNAAVFDIRRSPNAHLAFGTGMHNCLGKTLVRAETQVALQLLMERAPGMTLRTQQPRWRKNSFFRGLAALPLTLGEA